MTRFNPLLNKVAVVKEQHVASAISALVGLFSKCMVIFFSILWFSILNADAANNTALQQIELYRRNKPEAGQVCSDLGKAGEYKKM
jgi:hypothetical protein